MIHDPCTVKTDSRMVMRNLARDVMEDMRLRDTVCGMGGEPAHDRSTVA